MKLSRYAHFVVCVHVLWISIKFVLCNKTKLVLVYLYGLGACAVISALYTTWNVACANEHSCMQACINV